MYVGMRQYAEQYWCATDSGAPSPCIPPLIPKKPRMPAMNVLPRTGHMSTGGITAKTTYETAKALAKAIGLRRCDRMRTLVGVPGVCFIWPIMGAYPETKSPIHAL